VVLLLVLLVLVLLLVLLFCPLQVSNVSKAAESMRMQSLMHTSLPIALLTNPAILRLVDLGTSFQPVPDNIIVADVLTAPSVFVKHTRSTHADVPTMVLHPVVDEAQFNPSVSGLDEHQSLTSTTSSRAVIDSEVPVCMHTRVTTSTMAASSSSGHRADERVGGVWGTRSTGSAEYCRRRLGLVACELVVGKLL
jgi:hypothetical protein